MLSLLSSLLTGSVFRSQEYVDEFFGVFFDPTNTLMCVPKFGDGRKCCDIAGLKIWVNEFFCHFRIFVTEYFVPCHNCELLIPLHPSCYVELI